MPKKKSFDNNSSEQKVLLAQTLSSPVNTVAETADLPITPVVTNETSIDSLESLSPTSLTPAPAKPPRQSDESASSSSTDIHSPPAKPPRHFTLYGQSQDDEEGLIQQTDTVVKKVLNLVDTFGVVPEDDKDMTILRQTSPPIYVQQASTLSELDSQSPVNIESSTSVETFVVDPVRVTVTSHAPASSDHFEQPISAPLTVIATTSEEEEQEEKSPPKEIKELATNLTTTIFEDLEKEFEKHHGITREDLPAMPQSVATTHPSVVQSTRRPLMFVSLDSGFSITKSSSPLIEVATSKATPKVTTSVTIISPAQPEISSTTLSTINSDDEDEEEEPTTSCSTLMPNSSVASERSKFLQSGSKESSIDSNDTNPYDNPSPQQQVNTGSATPARSLISDYDNLHGSYGSLNDETQPIPLSLPPATTSSTDNVPSLPPTSSSSMSTIYETPDNFSTASTSTLTSPTYVSAASTLNDDEITGGSITPARRLNSDISDEDLVEAFEIETPVLTSVNPFRTSKGRSIDRYRQHQHAVHCSCVCELFGHVE